MDMRSLRYFVAVYEEQSFTAASKRCFVAQPSISEAVSQLEERLGVKLFLRHRKGITPTEEGQRLYGSAVRLLGEIDALAKLFDKDAGRASLCLGLMASLDAQRVGEFLGALQRSIQGLDLRLVTPEEPADARIISDHLRKPDEVFVPIWRERYLLALPHGHPLTLNEKITLRDIRGVPLIERCHCEFHDEVSAAISSLKRRVNIVAKAQGEDMALALVGAGVGVAIIPEGSARDRTRVVMREIADLRISRRVGLAYTRSAKPAKPLQAAIALCKRRPFAN